MSDYDKLKRRMEEAVTKLNSDICILIDENEKLRKEIRELKGYKGDTHYEYYIHFSQKFNRSVEKIDVYEEEGRCKPCAIYRHDVMQARINKKDDDFIMQMCREINIWMIHMNRYIGNYLIEEDEYGNPVKYKSVKEL